MRMMRQAFKDSFELRPRATPRNVVVQLNAEVE